MRSSSRRREIASWHACEVTSGRVCAGYCAGACAGCVVGRICAGRAAGFSAIRAGGGARSGSGAARVSSAGGAGAPDPHRPGANPAAACAIWTPALRTDPKVVGEGTPAPLGAVRGGVTSSQIPKVPAGDCREFLGSVAASGADTLNVLESRSTARSATISACKSFSALSVEIDRGTVWNSGVPTRIAPC